MLLLAPLSATSYYASVPQAPVTHAMMVFGQPSAGAPLFALHGVASMNPHSYDASFRIRLFSDEQDVTDSVQAARAAAPPGLPFYLDPGASSAPYLLPQLAGSYYGLPMIRSLEGYTLYAGYNPSNAKGARALAAAGKPVQQLANGTSVRFEPGEVVLTQLTIRISSTAVRLSVSVFVLSTATRSNW